MSQFAPAPKPVTAVYAWVLHKAILYARGNAKLLSADELIDLMDAVHNIPEMLHHYGGWHVEANIDHDLKRYDERWAGRSAGDWRLSLLDELRQARQSYLQDTHSTSS